MRSIFFLLPVFLISAIGAGDAPVYSSVPAARVKYADVYSFYKDTNSVFVPAFEMSTQVTLAEYREFVDAVMADSSQEKWLRYWPNAYFPSGQSIETYFTNVDNNNYPVQGISWDNAMAYCRWKTLKEYHKDSSVTLYRLPTPQEWIAADRNSDNGYTGKSREVLSDWLLASYDESAYTFENHLKGQLFEYWYADKKTDPSAMRRKRIAGDNFHFTPTDGVHVPELGYYAFQGYRYVGFRVVKKKLVWGKDAPKHADCPADLDVLKYWNLEVPTDKSN